MIHCITNHCSRKLAVATIALCMLAFGCAARQTPQPATAQQAGQAAATQHGAPWLLPHDARDPQLGLLQDANGALSEAELLTRALAVDVLYLGEVHDNADHHRLQAKIIAQLIEHGARPALVLEAVREDQQPLLNRLAPGGEAPAQRAEDYRDALDWQHSGWPDFAMYQPIFALAIAHKLPLVAGDVPRARIKQVAFGAQLSAEEARALGLDQLLPQPLQNALEAELKASHCGMLPDHALPAMAQAQRLRDATLAQHARRQPAQPRGPRSVVLTGNGHARRDRGAPAIAVPGATLRSLSVGLVELPTADDGPAPFDVRWLTPRAERDDPCMKWRASK